MKAINLAIFASGSGSNAREIIQYFSQHPTIKVALVLTNRKHAGVLEIAHAHNVETAYVPKSEFYESNRITTILREHNIDWIVLAGFLLKVPEQVLESYPDRIMNIHPSLLPKFGGKGMYGMHVHRAVKEAGALETGISIHLVNAEYDQGRLLKQVACTLTPEDTPEDIQRKVQQLEHEHYPSTIADTIMQKQRLQQ